MEQLKLFEDEPLRENVQFNLGWSEIKPAEYRRFQLGNEPEVLHIIKTGFRDKYIVTWEDAFEQMLGDIKILTKGEIKEKFDIEL